MAVTAAHAGTPAASGTGQNPAAVPSIFQPTEATAAGPTVDLSVEYIVENSYSGWKWECTEPWVSWKKALKDCPKLKILELCCSGGSPTHALRSLGIPIEVYQWNSDPDQKQFLEKANDNNENIHCGADIGNIMNTAIDGFPLVQWIFASPPLAKETAYMPLEVKGAIIRSEDFLAFHRTCAVIRHQARKGCLMNFIIEGDHWWLKVPNGNVCPLEYLKLAMQRYLGTEWCVVTGTYTAADFGLPHVRTKCYLRGHRIALYTNGVPVRVIPLSPGGRNQCRLRDLLIRSDPSNPDLVHGITDTGDSSKNLKTGRELLMQTITDGKFRDRIAVVPLHTKPYGIVTGWPSLRSQISFDIVSDLTKNDKIWLLSMDSLENPTVSQLLQNYERGALLGFPRAVCRFDCSEDNYSKVKKKVFSTAMPVPLVGAMVATSLLSIGRSIGFTALTEWISSGVLPPLDSGAAAPFVEDAGAAVEDTG